MLVAMIVGWAAGIAPVFQGRDLSPGALLRPDAGSARVLGIDVWDRRESDRAKAGAAAHKMILRETMRLGLTLTLGQGRKLVA